MSAYGEFCHGCKTLIGIDAARESVRTRSGYWHLACWSFEHAHSKSLRAELAGQALSALVREYNTRTEQMLIGKLAVDLADAVIVELEPPR